MPLLSVTTLPSLSIFLAASRIGASGPAAASLARGSAALAGCCPEPQPESSVMPSADVARSRVVRVRIIVDLRGAGGPVRPAVHPEHGSHRCAVQRFFVSCKAGYRSVLLKLA